MGLGDKHSHIKSIHNIFKSNLKCLHRRSLYAVTDCWYFLLIHLGWYAQKYETKRLNEKQTKKKDGECEKTAGCHEVIFQIQDGDWSSCGSAIPRWSVLERRNCQTGDLMLTPSTGSHRSYSGNVKISNKFSATSNKCFIINACCI